MNRSKTMLTISALAMMGATSGPIPDITYTTGSNEPPRPPTRHSYKPYSPPAQLPNAAQLKAEERRARRLAKRGYK